MEGLDSGRWGWAAGVDRAAPLELSLKYCAERKQFDSRSRTSRRCNSSSDMATRTEAGGAGASGRRAQRCGRGYHAVPSMAKLFASETAMWVKTQAIQLSGVWIHARFPVEKLFPGCKVNEIMKAHEIQRVVSPRLTHHS